MTINPDIPSGSQSSAAANEGSQQQNAPNAANTASQQRNAPANIASPVIIEIQDPHNIVDYVGAAQKLINTVDRLGQEELDADETLEQSYTFRQADYDAATEKFEKREFGFIAQDVAAQLPETYSDARVSFNETDSRIGFDVQRFTMGDMTPILWKALRELSNKHDQLQSDYDALLARVVALENA